MDRAGIWCMAAGLLTVVCAVGMMVYNHYKVKRILVSLDKMLDTALNGSFKESVFDESMMSAIETKMIHYLSALEVSSNKLRLEKNNIKELIGDISHQTKTPVSNILLYGQLLEETELAGESREYLQELIHQTEKLNFLINSLVKTSRLETGIFTLVPEKTPVSILIKEVMEQISPKAKKQGVLLAAGSIEGEAVFDKKWTVEALYNIVDNAVKYTKCGGYVEMQVVFFEMYCRIDIKDSGPGIAEEEQPKVFQRFYRSPEVRETEGLGIGLYLSREIVSGEDGYIKVVSKKGEGSTFSVFLPVKR